MESFAMLQCVFLMYFCIDKQLFYVLMLRPCPNDHVCSLYSRQAVRGLRKYIVSACGPLLGTTFFIVQSSAVIVSLKLFLLDIYHRLDCRN